MSLRLIRTERTSEEDLQRFKADQEDFEWLVRHSREIEEQSKGKYIAVVNKEVFVGDSFEEAEQKAKAKYPERDPYVEFIPLKPRVMVL